MRTIRDKTPTASASFISLSLYVSNFYLLYSFIDSIIHIFFSKTSTMVVKVRTCSYY